MPTLTSEAIAERIAHFGPLKAGKHDPNGEACVMEAVSWVAGEKWSDHPACACPVIAEFLRSWNDGLFDDDRDRLLRPLIPRLVGTVNAKLENRRATMAADWLIRVHTPAWLRLAGLATHADALSRLPEITDFSQVPHIRSTIEAAQLDAAAAGTAAWDAAGAAAWDAAGDAARAAAGDAARAAAWAAARDAAWAAAWVAGGAAARAAAWDAARVAAWAAGGAAARAAARAAAEVAAEVAGGAAAGVAAWAALSRTLIELQQSALALVERMIEADFLS